jgi:hypothetical protein
MKHRTSWLSNSYFADSRMKETQYSMDMNLERIEQAEISSVTSASMSSYQWNIIQIQSKQLTEPYKTTLHN